MIAQLLKRRILPDVPERVYARLIQHSLLLTAAIILVGGFLRMAQLDLTESQLYLACGIVFGLFLQCVILWVLIEIARKLILKAVEPGPQAA